MLSVIQRVSRASVTVEAESYHQSIGPGLCVLLGVQVGDTDSDAKWMASKLARLRIFRDDQNKMNRSVQDIAGEILLISQFTLAGDATKGNRPSFIDAAPPEVGEKLYEQVARLLTHEQGLLVKKGIFGAMMQVELVNDGPVTLILSSRI
ncbi:MAG: D-aminoacyl-tRNA deacylase [Phycisphaerales bacterium]|nr:D-aminoacyl-tRNA deacylase [Phycisphaerales bacterium]MCI0674927.1 D-aminoacyl-tRNA deacylase [Phycisphaerales bacterium]